MKGTRKFGAATCTVKRSMQIPVHMRDGIREVSHVYVPFEQRRQGYATGLMRDLCAEADRLGLVLLVHAKPYADWEMDLEGLQRWYERFGFAVIQAEPRLMARMVGATPRIHLIPIQQAING